MITDFPIWLPYVHGGTALALPHEPASSVLDLARHFGSTTVAVLGADDLRAELATGSADARCFEDVDAARHPGARRPRLGHPSHLPDRVPMTGPYTPKPMDAARSSDDTMAVRDVRIDGLRAEASEAVGYSANTLRAVAQRYRTAYTDELARWQELRDELDAAERSASPEVPPRSATDGDGAATATAPDADGAAFAAEVGAEDARVRALRSQVDSLGRELGVQQTELAKLEIALRNLESTWLFLERGDSSLLGDGETLATDVQMRIVEAQESERSRLAQEVHDGPAQVLANAIFQVEYIERVIDTDLRTAKTELRFLRDLLRRELGSVRTFISQLRPPVLDELGLDGAITDAIGRVTALTGLAISADLAAPDGPTERGPADGGAARPAGSTAECAQARRGLRRHRRQRDRRRRMGPRPSATTDEGSTSERSRLVAGGTSASNSCESARN